MEINNSANIQPQAGSAPAAKVAASGSEMATAERPKLPVVEAKAPPKVPEFKASDIEKAVAELQAFVDGLDRSLSFRRDESIDRSIITVRDANTNQLVRQIPAEEVVEVARQIKESMDKLRSGVLMNGEA